jgi:very-short-patch-repair endonuclease
MICQYCGKECKNLKSLIQHKIRCKYNPNRIDMSYIKPGHTKGHKGTNQYSKAIKLGLDKPIVSKETKDKISKKLIGKLHSDKTKQKLSEIRKQYLEEHPDKIPFKLNHSSKKSYPEQYFEELFINENIPLKYHKQVGRYELDFYNEDLMKYVEIDGEQHYQMHMIKHDNERNEYLKQKGWEGIRIRWSEYKKMTNKEKENKIKEIVCFLGVND